MAIFKQQYKDRITGKIRKSQKWYIELPDHIGIRRRLAAYESKRASEALYSRISELISYAAAGQTPEADLQRWIDTLPEVITGKLADWGIVSGGRVSAGVLTAQHIAAFKQSLIDKGCTAQHIKTVLPRIEKTTKACKAINLTDINTNKIQRYIADLQASEQTKKHYVRALKQFSKWLYDTGRTSADMLSRLDTPQVNDTVVSRRALTPSEAARLLEAAKASNVEFRNVSGYERYLIYSLALSTGLRANEIRTLTIADFNFIGHTVSIKPRNEKARRGATLPIKAELSEEIRAFTSLKHPSARVLNPTGKPSAMLQIDLKAANIEFRTEQGQVDFHALRHTFGTWLAQNGVAPQVAQRLMRHSDPRLTQNLYTHLVISDLRSGADKLPDYTRAKEKQSATGTIGKQDDLPYSTAYSKLSAEGGFMRTLADANARGFESLLNVENPAYCTKNGVFNTVMGDKKEKATVGFEPTNIGFANRRLRPLGYVAEEKL